MATNNGHLQPPTRNPSPPNPNLSPPNPSQAYAVATRAALKQATDMLDQLGAKQASLMSVRGGVPWGRWLWHPGVTA